MKSEDIKYIVVHCSATTPDQDIGFKEIDKMHKAKGWNGCGYHFIIRRNGAIETGRPLQTKGAHVRGHNSHSWGVCLVGGLDYDTTPIEDDFTSAQLTSLNSIISGLLYRAPKAEVLGHRDLSPDLDGDGVVEKHEWLKQCPCMDAKEWFYR
jgi:N-acetyl-anhydromuramyl-L-alanine amidase AmpD